MRRKCKSGEEKRDRDAEREKETFRRQRHHQSDRSWAVCVHLVVGHGTCWTDRQAQTRWTDRQAQPFSRPGRADGRLCSEMNRASSMGNFPSKINAEIAVFDKRNKLNLDFVKFSQKHTTHFFLTENRALRGGHLHDSIEVFFA